MFRAHVRRHRTGDLLVLKQYNGLRFKLLMSGMCECDGYGPKHYHAIDMTDGTHTYFYCGSAWDAESVKLGDT